MWDSRVFESYGEVKPAKVMSSTNPNSHEGRASVEQRSSNQEPSCGRSATVMPPGEDSVTHVADQGSKKQ